MKRKILCLVSIIAVILLVVVLKKEDFVSSSAITKKRNSDTTTEIVEKSTQGFILNANELIKDSMIEEDMNHNTRYLQGLIDEVSDIGGGVVHIPAGTFYFTAGGINARGSENYVIRSRSNVLVEGEGVNEETGTILKPYGTPENGLDMFYYNNYRDTHGEDKTYIINADFRNFVIDSEKAVGKQYNTSGKGFMLNLYKNCDWENVVVKNTDGTGFGMDNPINCTVKNCVAINCGKTATTDNVGASGFGIGTGFSEQDSIYISNCTSIGNKKYGFFFEHQGRFQTLYRATKSESLVVSNCQAKGNLYNFGAARGNDVTYENCTSLQEDSGSANRAGFHFEQVSRRINLVNCKVEKEFTDVADTSKYYYEPVYWALDNGISDGSTATTFEPDKACTRTHALAFLYRMIGRPGEVFFGGFDKTNNAENMENAFRTQFTDVDVDASCVDAIKWAEDEGILDFMGTEFLPNTACTKETFIKILWKYAGSPIVETTHGFTDVEQGADYEAALNWAVSKQIVSGTTNGTFGANDACTRGTIVTYLYRFYNSCDTYKITYNLNQGRMENENPTSYIKGADTITLQAPVKDGYIFEGWTGSSSSQIGYVGRNYTPSKEVSITTQDRGDKVYTANWTPIEYIVTFDGNPIGGGMEPQTLKYDCPQMLPENKFVNKGYIFKGWNTKSGGTGVSYKDKEVVNNIIQLDNSTHMLDKKVQLYAQWELPNPNDRKNIFIGDSTIVEMQKIIGGNETWIGERGQGIDWLKNTAIPSIESNIDEMTNIVIKIATNDLFDLYLNNGNVDIDSVVNMYSEYLNAKTAQYTQLGAKVYFVLPGPVDDSKIDFTTRKINNADIVEFNTKIKTELQGITIIDIYSEIIDDFNAKTPDLTREDGTHGTALYYAKIYNVIKDALEQDYIPTFEAFENMTDVPDEANYIDALKWAYENVVIDPISANEFGPNQEMNRAEAITALWRSQGIPYYTTQLSFTDIDKNEAYCDAIKWGVGEGIVTGVTDTEFRPQEVNKRGYFLIFIWRLAGAPIVETGNNFTDVSEESTYINAINWAVNVGLIEDGGKFRPEEACTRADLVTFLYDNYRLQNKETEKSDIITSEEFSVNEEELIITDINPKTPIQEFIQQLTSEMDYEITDKDGDAIAEGSYIGTGCKIKMENGKEYTLIVWGDLTGDGEIAISELAVAARKAVNPSTELDELHLLALDVSKDGNIKIPDLAVLSRLYNSK